MTVGPLKSYTTVLCGHATLTLTDGSGNIIAIRKHSNIVNTQAKKILASCAHNGGAGVSALYVYICSAMNGTPTLSMGQAFSSYGQYSVNLSNNPQTLTWSFHNDTQWSVNGTMSFVGYGGFSSIDAAALCYSNWGNSWSASVSLLAWFAQACFTDLAINSVDKLSFNWAFSLSTTTSTAV